jgi:predicted transcriptional regulator
VVAEYGGDAMAIAEQLVQARAEMELLRPRAGQLADALAETQDDLDAAKGSAAKARKALTDLRARDEALSGLLRGMARRLGALRRDYNTHFIDPWEIPEYCAKATPQSPCWPAVRDWDLCIDHVRKEMKRLHALLAEMRARDEAARAAVRAWVKSLPNGRHGTPSRVVAALDALARTHETGGTDR